MSDDYRRALRVIEDGISSQRPELGGGSDDGLGAEVDVDQLESELALGDAHVRPVQHRVEWGFDVVICFCLFCFTLLCFSVFCPFFLTAQLQEHESRLNELDREERYVVWCMVGVNVDDSTGTGIGTLQYLTLAPSMHRLLAV